MVITSKNENNYFLSKKYNQLFILHPIMKIFLDLEKEGIDINKQIKSYLKKKENKFFKGISIVKLRYYYKKFNLFKTSGIFEELERTGNDNLKIDSGNIKYYLANTPQVVFEATEACNLKCTYCCYGNYYTDYDSRNDKNLNITTGFRVLDYLIPLWNSNLNSSYKQKINISFYGGEPLLNFPFINKIVKYADQIKLKRHKFVFNITTNGTLLDKYMDFLKEKDFEILISLDGSEKNNVYRLFHNGKSSFKKVFSNIMLLKNKYPTYFKNKIQFNAVLHNKNSVSSIYSFFWRNFNKVPMISELDQTGLKANLTNDFIKMFRGYSEGWEQSENLEYIGDIIFGSIPKNRDLINFFKTYNGYIYEKYRDLFNMDVTKAQPTTGTCLPFSNRVFITVNGKVLPCEKIGHQYALSHQSKKNIEFNFEKIAQKYNKYFSRKLDLCKECQLYYDSCPTCMFKLNLKGRDLKCRELVTQEDLNRRISSHISYLEERPELCLKIQKAI